MRASDGAASPLWFALTITDADGSASDSGKVNGAR